ncbi:MAG: ADP-ribose pyrophosphatase [Paracoccaceae bacterium]
MHLPDSQAYGFTPTQSDGGGVSGEKRGGIGLTALFVYGSLRHRPLLQLVLGSQSTAHGVCAMLPGHAVHEVEGANFPIIVKAAAQSAEGLLLLGLNDADIARLDFYEGGFGYTLTDVSVQVEGRTVAAQVYWPDEGHGLRPGAPWSLARWEETWAALSLATAADIMAFFGKISAKRVAQRFGVMTARAQARLNAAQSAPVLMRHRAEPDDITLERLDTPYAHFFAVEEYHLRHRRFDGTMGTVIERAVFVQSDAVVMLPYDPLRDRVLVIEQFRVGAFGRGDPQPWSIEAIAGRIDGGETPEQAARREALEEAGLSLNALVPIGNYYPSPGAVTEYLYTFIGLADLPDTAAGLGGLASEDEDIRAHVMSFDAFMAMVDHGEAGNGPLVLAALQLARRRTDLRAQAHG